MKRALGLGKLVAVTLRPRPRTSARPSKIRAATRPHTKCPLDNPRLQSAASSATPPAPNAQKLAPLHFAYCHVPLECPSSSPFLPALPLPRSTHRVRPPPWDFLTARYGPTRRSLFALEDSPDWWQESHGAIQGPALQLKCGQGIRQTNLPKLPTLFLRLSAFLRPQPLSQLPIPAAFAIREPPFITTSSTALALASSGSRFFHVLSFLFLTNLYIFNRHLPTRISCSLFALRIYLESLGL
jgi:hypothetical protein